MFSYRDTNLELTSINNDKFSLWNYSIQNPPQIYAAQFPYGSLSESLTRKLMNSSIISEEIMRSALKNITLNNRITFADNDTNYESCSMAQDPAWFSTEFQATVHFMYITILLIAIFGNAIVCFIVCTSSRMQTVTNYFIANLALSDMLMAFFCIPFSFISLFVLQ